MKALVKELVPEILKEICGELTTRGPTKEDEDIAVDPPTAEEDISFDKVLASSLKTAMENTTSTVALTVCVSTIPKPPCSIGATMVRRFTFAGLPFHRKEWNTFIEELYDAIQQQLTESHVQAFSDLTEAERMLFMERAAKAIQGGKSYIELYGKVSVSLDQHLNNEVARQLLEEYPINTKSDLVLEAAQDGAVSLLKKWPDMKSKLHINLNQPLPENLRQLAWKLYLDNTKVRKRYVDLLMNNPRAAISPQDLEISQRCERLLTAEPSFNEIRGSIGAFYGMKATLSYHHCLKRTKDRLIDTDYMLSVPFVFVCNGNISRREPAPNHVVALLVEEYLTFMDIRPGCVVDSGSEVQNEEYKAYVGKVAKHLQERSPETAKAIGDAYLPSKEKIVATEKGTWAILVEGLTSLLRPVIRTMFVGFLRMEVVLFIWDQFMIGLDAPGFHDEYLPMITAIFLMLLNTNIKDAQSPEQLAGCLKANGLQLKIPQFQYEMNKHFYKDLFALLNQDDRAALPVLDPTQANHQPWVHWFSDRVPHRTTPQDRRKARDEREAERQRMLQQQREEERRKEMDEIVARKREQSEYINQQDQDRQRLVDDRLMLEEALNDERGKRYEAEQSAAAEIERLRKEVEALREAKARAKTPGGITLESRISRYLIPPPPTAASTYTQPPPPMKLPTPTPRRITPTTRSPSLARQTPQTQTQNVIKNFIKRIANSFNQVGQGDGQERQNLDRETKSAIKDHREDVKMAEIEVFGRALKPGEFAELPDEEQDDKSDELMEVIKRRLEERRKQQLKKGNM